MPTWLMEKAAPIAARWAVFGLLAAAVFGLGVMVGITHEGEKHTAYVLAQAKAVIPLQRAQNQVFQKAEIQYRDRIIRIYQKGEALAQAVPQYVTPTDAGACTINTGFVRVHDAGWSGDDPAPATDADREPAAVSLADVAETNTENASICRAWRQQALSLREAYQQLEKTTNDAAGVK